jgi:hypothetical protein
MPTILHKLVCWLSLEWFLSNRRANGGTVIFLRAMGICVELLVATVALWNALDPERSNAFSSHELRKQLIHLAPWIAASFAGIYLALYARFSAQWGYLANLYNQIKQTEIGVHATQSHADRQRQMLVLCQWKAGYIEDAQDLHLAGKSNVAAIIKSWGSSQEVERLFISATLGGENRWKKLMFDVDAAVQRTEQELSK